MNRSRVKRNVCLEQWRAPEINCVPPDWYKGHFLLQTTESQSCVGEDPNNPIRIYADGVFDLLHLGHMRQLEQCKRMFKYVHLIVGISPDEEVHRYKVRISTLKSELFVSSGVSTDWGIRRTNLVLPFNRVKQSKHLKNVLRRCAIFDG